jgi:glycosyltransferase involved in cell wall biosynthesis
MGASQRGSEDTKGSIMILVSSTQRRGAEVFGEHLAGALRESGYETWFLALSQAESGSSVSATPIFAASEIAGISGLKPRVIKRLRAAFTAHKPDVILAGGGATLKYSVAALTGLRERPILVYSSIGEPEFWATSLWRKRMMSALLGRTELVTAVSQATADQLVRSFGVNPARVHVVHPGVPAEFLSIERRDPVQGRLNVLYLGSLSAEKNPLAAVEAVTAMESEATLRMVGDGPLLGAVEQEARNGRARMEVVGPADDVSEHLGWADVLVLTSKTEGLPGVILESGAAGVPVVSFGVGGVAEAVEDGVTGLVIEPGDTQAMSRALDLLAREPDLRFSMASAGRVKIANHFLLSHALDRYLDVLDEVFKN